MNSSRLSAGWWHTCGLTSTGSATCWGWNDYGQVSPTPSGPFVALSAGYYHTCGLTSTGSATCWGANGYGR